MVLRLSSAATAPDDREVRPMATDELARSFASTRGVLANVTRDQFGESTPCRSWTVGALVNHIVGAPRFAVAAIKTGVAAGADDDYTTGNFLAQYDETSTATIGAFGMPGALEKTVTLPFGDIPVPFLLMMVATDQFTHGWDLARATGQSTDLDADLAAGFLAQARASVSDQFRGDDGVAPFGPEQRAPAGSCAADQLAAFLGRSV
jgi:uncharacterized protein (TIGR03086 family)